MQMFASMVLREDEEAMARRLHANDVELSS